MASGDNDHDAEDALSKLLQMGSLDANEDIHVDELSNAIDYVIYIGESNKVRSKKSRGAAEGERRALCYVQDSKRRKKKRWRLKFKEDYEIPESRFFRQHLEDKVISKEWVVLRP
nr:hypothetical protein [Tanacetum cinerariifolium]